MLFPFRLAARRRSRGGRSIADGTDVRATEQDVDLDVHPFQVLPASLQTGIARAQQGAPTVVLVGIALEQPFGAQELDAPDGRATGTLVVRDARELVQRFQRAPIQQPVLLNVNVPNVAYAELSGVETTRLGRRHKAEPVVKLRTPRGETAYWIGPAGGAQDAGPGTDFFAVEQRRVSVTPLQVDLTFPGQLALVKDWLAR